MLAHQVFRWRDVFGRVRLALFFVFFPSHHHTYSKAAAKTGNNLMSALHSIADMCDATRDDR